MIPLLSVMLPWPDPKVSPNYKNWRAKARAVKAARMVAYHACLDAGGHFTAADLADAKCDPIHVRWTFRPPDARRRDEDNMIGAKKPFQDGIADALKVDDSRFKVVAYTFGAPLRGVLRHTGQGCRLHEPGGMIVFEIVRLSPAELADLDRMGGALCSR